MSGEGKRGAFASDCAMRAGPFILLQFKGNPMMLYDTTADVSQADIGNLLRYLLDSVKKCLHQDKIRV
ncbi:MAG: hypothetical protein LBT06_03320 [Hungatella sp.]|jgi:hypothetical protein|nr:hypothetical protein [Hungatella sp.]